MKEHQLGWRNYLLAIEFVSPKVTEYFYFFIFFIFKVTEYFCLNLDCAIRNPRTTIKIKAALCVPSRIGLVWISIGRPSSKPKYYVTLENMPCWPLVYKFINGFVGPLLSLYPPISFPIPTASNPIHRLFPPISPTLLPAIPAPPSLSISLSESCLTNTAPNASARRRWCLTIRPETLSVPSVASS